MVIQGIIRPPPEIRAVADRTALYVAKNGRGFEVRILNSEKGKTPKFAFLQPNNPFHAYYEDRISFYEKGGKDEDPKKADEKEKEEKKKEEAPKSSEDSGSRKEGRAVASVLDPVAKAILAQRNKIAQIRSTSLEDGERKESEESKEETNEPGARVVPPPPPLYFINIVAPSSLSVAQIETIQLVAQMTALDSNGGGFLQALTLREWNNPDFAFCQPRHGLFAYFSALVDAYRRVLLLWTSPSLNQQQKTSSITSVKDSNDDYTPLLANNTDMCLEMAAYRAEYERDQAMHRKQDGDGLPASALVDWNDFVVVETIDFPVDEKVLTLPPPPPSTAVMAPSKLAAPTATTPAAARNEDDMDDSEEEDSEQIRVVPSYTPKIVSTQASSNEMVIDPITGKSVPVKDLPEHMRIQLLDPKWAEERKKFQEKQKESNLVGGDVVANNLARFAQARGMGADDALSKEDAKKRLEDANRVLREQSLASSTPVGPALPGAAAGQAPQANKPSRPPPGFDAPLPDAKKARIDTSPQPPPPPSAAESSVPKTTVVAPPSEPPAISDPFAAALNTAETAGPGHSVGAPSLEPLSEEAFAASLPRRDVTLQIRVPNDPAQMAWNFYGQILSLSVDVMSKVKAVKQELSRLHLNGMPANKIQLKSSEKGVFLKDSLSLAALNIASATLELVPKTRGGRK